MSPAANSASPPNSPENSFFSLTLSVTIGGRLACLADTRLQPATAVHSNTSATAHAYFAEASVGTRQKTCKHGRRRELRELHRLLFPWTSRAPSCRSCLPATRKMPFKGKRKAGRRGGATQLSVFSHHAPLLRADEWVSAIAFRARQSGSAPAAPRPRASRHRLRRAGSSTDAARRRAARSGRASG